jgi:hypothetical protein
MAMGLSLFGRRARQSTNVVIHVLASAFGGALGGAAVGAVGAALTLERWRPWVVLGAALLALRLGLRRPARPLGIHRQVPKYWGAKLGDSGAYAAWGVLLGLGVTTTIPYSAYVLLVGVQLASGPILGAIAGAAFGAGREGVASVSAVRLHTPSEIADRLPRFRRMAARLNVVVIAAGGIGFTALRWF